jgi:hypothetical protein
VEVKDFKRITDLCPRRTGGSLQMNRLGLGNNRLKSDEDYDLCPGELPIRYI